MEYYIPFQMYFCVSVSLCFSCVFLFLLLSCKISPSRYKRRGYFSIKDGIDWDAQTGWMKLDMVFDLHQ